MTRRYAEGTTVSAEKSKLEIEQILTRYGATSFASGWQGGVAVIAFEAKGRRIKFTLPLPDAKDKGVTHKRNDGWNGPTETEKKERVEQETRRRWRALALAIKAKLEVVESGIATFEQEFMAHVVLPNGATVGEWMEPQLDSVYRSGHMPPLLTAGGGK
jgi:hypothetical protein